MFEDVPAVKITHRDPMSIEAKADVIVIKSELVMLKAMNKVRARGPGSSFLDKRYDRSVYKMYCALNGIKYNQEIS